MTISAARIRELKQELELDGCLWVATEGSILVPQARTVVITIGIKLKSQASGRSNNWRATYGRSQQLRKRTAHALALIDVAQVTKHLGAPARKIVFVRMAARKLDSDNLVAAFKPIRDQVCCWLAGDNALDARADDGTRSGYVFEYRQQPQRLNGVRVELSC